MKYNFDQIWEDFSGKIRTFISRRVSNPSHIDDILQEVFIKIHLHLDKLNTLQKTNHAILPHVKLLLVLKKWFILFRKNMQKL
jgi:hypothetical protein